jgi:hypothetical protein
MTRILVDCRGTEVYSRELRSANFDVFLPLTMGFLLTVYVNCTRVVSVML